jgi:hypothetical protein
MTTMKKTNVELLSHLATLGALLLPAAPASQGQDLAGASAKATPPSQLSSKEL